MFSRCTLARNTLLIHSPCCIIAKWSRSDRTSCQIRQLQPCERPRGQAKLVTSKFLTSVCITTDPASRSNSSKFLPRASRLRDSRRCIAAKPTPHRRPPRRYFGRGKWPSRKNVAISIASGKGRKTSGGEEAPFVTLITPFRANPHLHPRDGLLPFI